MKNQLSKALVISLLIISTFSCDDSQECPLCFTPPEELSIRITDQNNGEDLIFNGTYKAEEIAISYMVNSNIIDVEVVVIIDQETKKALIISNEIAWKSLEGIKNFSLYLSPTESYPIFLDVVVMKGDCCTFHEYKDFEINESIIERDPIDRIYNFKI